ncbi:hypothetical protein [Dokdonella sp.]|uniref:hypothetical protein n=1 Tax=Dokdonella sp. TaxID=2291710 RepID=UPI0031C66A9E|nr:glycosyltransferase family 39 protein [Dokdonella sp.]
MQAFIGRNKALFLILTAFFLVSCCLAATKDFPAVFDEGYHFALIDFYSGKVSPFISTQPEELAMVGDATRLSSYLSHFFLGVPLWLTKIFTDDMFTQIVVLRFINVAAVMVALLLFYRFLVRLVGSNKIASVAIGIYCLIPVTSQLSSTINYDNWILLCFSVTCLIVQRLYTQVLRDNKISFNLVVLLVSVLGVSSLVKYTFLPIAVAIIAVILFFVVVRFIKRRPIKWSVAPVRRIILPILVLLAVTGLVAERYGYNLYAYGSPQPDCAAVQPLEVCLQYGPWARNYALATIAETKEFTGVSLPSYVVHLWLPISTQGLSYFGSNDTMVSLSLMVRDSIGVVISVLVLGVFVAFLRNNRQFMYIMLISVSGVFIITLVNYNYAEYMRFHEPIAIQGRYLLPLLIPVMALGLVGLRTLYRSIVQTYNISRYLWISVDEMNLYQAYLFSKQLWLTDSPRVR